MYEAQEGFWAKY